MTPLMFILLATLLTAGAAVFCGVTKTDKTTMYIVGPLAIIMSFGWRNFLGYTEPTFFERILFYLMAGSFSYAFFSLGRRFKQ